MIMKKYAGSIILGIVGLALIVGLTIQQRQIRGLEQQLGDALASVADQQRERADAERRLRAENAQAEADKARLQDTLDRLQAELDRVTRQAADEKASLETQVAALADQPPSPPPAPAAPSPGETAATADDRLTTPPSGKEMFKQIGDMMKNPAMKEIVRSQQKAVLDMTYQAMFDALDLTDEQEAQLKDLLLEKQMAQMELGLEMMNGDLTEEQQEDLTARMEAATAEYDKAIREILGDEDYEWYEAYEETKNERMQLMMFNQSLAADNRLTVEQQDALTLAMFSARSEFKSLSDLQNPNTVDPSQFNPEQINRILADMQAVYEQYLTRAESILTPQQLEQFRAFLDQQRGMQEMGLRMMQRMFSEQNGP
jgi:hypothetical protein